MPAVAPDANVIGHFRRLAAIWNSPAWREVWHSLNLREETFQSLNLTPQSTDDHVWRACQERHVVLITGNRNDDGPTSLESTIRICNSPTSLPVITLSDPQRTLDDGAYAEMVAERILEVLLELDNYMGVGRIYVP